MDTVFSRNNDLEKATSAKAFSEKPSYLEQNVAETGLKKILEPVENKTAELDKIDDNTEPSCFSNRLDRGRVVVFIDGSNLFYAAAQLGIEIDYLKLLSCLTTNGRLVHAFFYTGVDPANEKQQGFLFRLHRSGFRVITKPLTQLSDGSRKGNLDVEIAVDMVRLAKYCDTAVLVSGDGDFAYAINTIAYWGTRVEVVGLRAMTHESLVKVADCYIDISSLKQAIQKQKGSYVVPAS